MRYKWKQILETIEKQHDMNSTDRKLLVFLHYSGVIPAAKFIILTIFFKVDFIQIPPMPFDVQIKADSNKNEYCVEDPNVNVDYVCVHYFFFYLTLKKYFSNKINLIFKKR